MSSCVVSIAAQSPCDSPGDDALEAHDVQHAAIKTRVNFALQVVLLYALHALPASAVTVWGEALTLAKSLLLMAVAASAVYVACDATGSARTMWVQRTAAVLSACSCCAFGIISSLTPLRCPALIRFCFLVWGFWCGYLAMRRPHAALVAHPGDPKWREFVLLMPRSATEIET